MKIFDPEIIHEQIACVWPRLVEEDYYRDLPNPNNWYQNHYIIAEIEELDNHDLITHLLPSDSIKIKEIIFERKRFGLWCGDIVYYWYEWKQYEKENDSKADG